MNRIELQALLEKGWRQPLTAEETSAIQEWCRTHPESRSEIEADLALSRALHAMPDAEMPSNFMAQVWEGIERDERQEARTESRARSFGGTWRQWLPRWAAVGGIACLALVGWWQHDVAQREELAAGLEVVSGGGEVPDPAMLKEFDAIQVMSQASAPVDVELLSALR